MAVFTTIFMAALMSSQLIGAAVAGGMSGNKMAQKQCESKQLLDQYTKNLSDMQNQLSNQIAQEVKDEQAANGAISRIQQQMASIEKSQNTKEKMLYSVQEFNNEMYRINVIFIIIFGTLFIVLLINFIKRRYKTVNCPYQKLKLN